MRWALPGPVYVPFCGDGDLAVAHYLARPIYAADIEPEHVQEAREALPASACVVQADCESWVYPNLGAETAFAVADFDSYSYPYTSFRSFWSCAAKLDRLVLFFTDGERQSAKRVGSYREPDGTRVKLNSLYERRDTYNAYLFRVVWPWFDAFVASEGWRVLDRFRYLRQDMAYWGAVIER